MRWLFRLQRSLFSFRTLSSLLLVIGAGVAVGYGLSSLSQQAASGGKSSTASTETLPQDVYPDSRNRLPVIKREDLDEQGQKLYDLHVSREGGTLAGLQGPGEISLFSPKFAELNRPKNLYLRSGTGLPRRLTELAILVTARELDAQFEWTFHEPEALKVGLERQIIDVVKYRKPVTGLGKKEATIIQLGREGIGKRKVPPDTFARALKLFGKQGLVDLVSLMGDYSGTALLLAVFNQQLPPGQKPLLPLP